MSLKIYKLTNTKTGLEYVGWTGKTLQQRFNKHFYDAKHKKGPRRVIYIAMRKYKKKYWRAKILYIGGGDLEGIKGLEKMFIDKYDTFRNGYNANGGSG